MRFRKHKSYDSSNFPKRQVVAPQADGNNEQDEEDITPGLLHTRPKTPHTPHVMGDYSRLPHLDAKSKSMLLLDAECIDCARNSRLISSLMSQNSDLEGIIAKELSHLVHNALQRSKDGRDVASQIRELADQQSLNTFSQVIRQLLLDVLHSQRMSSRAVEGSSNDSGEKAEDESQQQKGEEFREQFAVGSECVRCEELLAEKLKVESECSVLTQKLDAQKTVLEQLQSENQGLKSERQSISIKSKDLETQIGQLSVALSELQTQTKSALEQKHSENQVLLTRCKDYELRIEQLESYATIGSPISHELDKISRDFSQVDVQFSSRIQEHTATMNQMLVCLNEAITNLSTYQAKCAELEVRLQEKNVEVEIALKEIAEKRGVQNQLSVISQEFEVLKATLERERTEKDQLLLEKDDEFEAIMQDSNRQFQEQFNQIAAENSKLKQEIAELTQKVATLAESNNTKPTPNSKNSSSSSSSNGEQTKTPADLSKNNFDGDVKPITLGGNNLDSPCSVNSNSSTSSSEELKCVCSWVSLKERRQIFERLASENAKHMTIMTSKSATPRGTTTTPRGSTAGISNSSTAQNSTA